jgi:ligand-binding SRPBCC domain-containing protein
LPPRSLEPGTRVVLRTHVGPVPVQVESEHVLFDPARRLFADRMLGGSFRAWHHEHRVEAAAAGARLIDDIVYELPLGRLGELVAGTSVRRRLDRLFDYRHAMTRLICEGRTPDEARRLIRASV